MTGISCRICGNATGNRLHRAREMQFGTGEEFDYVECAGCGCVQIAEIPADLQRFYEGLGLGRGDLGEDGHDRASWRDTRFYGAGCR